MSNSIKDIAYHDKILNDFSEAVYQKMASKRFAIDFCCKQDLVDLEIDKELLDLNELMDQEVEPSFEQDL
jgi:hypothetical protein